MDDSTVRGWVVHFSRGDSGSPPLVQTFVRAACRLLFITAENGQPVVGTVLKTSVLQLRICSIKQHYCALCMCFSFLGNTT